MRLSTKIWLVLAIISNVLLIYFFGAMIDSIKYSDRIYFEFTVESYIGIAAFAVANVATTIVFVRFLKRQPLSRQIFFSTVPPTVTLVIFILFFFTITTTEQTDLVTAVRAGLGIYNPSSRYIWIALIAVAYVVYLLITYHSLSKPLTNVERAVEVLKQGKTRKPIKVGGGRQFQNIEYDLNVINNNYKESEKILNMIDPEIIEEAIEEVAPKPATEIPSNILVKTK